MFLGHLRHRYKRQVRRLDVQFHNRNVNIVEKGYDAAICVGELKNLSIVAVKLLDSLIHLVASAEYLQQHAAPLTAQALTEHACIAFGPPSPTMVWTLANEGE